jgi:hypothetical protein
VSDELDAWLDSSKPGVARRTLTMDSAIEQVVLAGRTRRRRWRRPVLAGAISVVLLGGGTSVAIAGTALEWFGPTDAQASFVRDGQWCVEGYRVVENPPSEPPSESLEEARSFVSGLDVDSLDLSPYLELVEGSRNPESGARGLAIQDAVAAHLRSEGLPAGTIFLEAGGECAVTE